MPIGTEEVRALFSVVHCSGVCERQVPAVRSCAGLQLLLRELLSPDSGTKWKTLLEADST